MKQNDMQHIFKTQTVIVAILAVTAIEIVALLKGVNGTALSATIGIISAMVGYLIRGSSQGKENNGNNINREN